MTALVCLGALLAAFALGLLTGTRRSASVRLELEQERDTMKALAVELHAENGLMRCELAPEQYANRFGGEL